MPWVAHFRHATTFAARDRTGCGKKGNRHLAEGIMPFSREAP